MNASGAKNASGVEEFSLVGDKCSVIIFPSFLRMQTGNEI